MERDLSEFEICDFIMLSPKLLNSFEKASGLLEIYLECLKKVCLSLKFEVTLPSSTCCPLHLTFNKQKKIRIVANICGEMSRR